MKSKLSKAFTLVELVSVIILMASFLVVFINVLNPAVKGYFKIKDQNTLVSNSDLIVSYARAKLQESFKDFNCKMIEQKFQLKRCEINKYPELEQVQLSFELEKNDSRFKRDKWLNY